MNIVGIVQARMSSTRLPGKVLKPVLGRPLLSYQMERLFRSKRITSWVVATSTDQSDDPIAEFCSASRINIFRGSLSNVLERYYLCAKQYSAANVLRITGDCPLVDPAVIDEMTAQFITSYDSYDYLSNSLVRSYPRGLDAEVFKFSALEMAYRNAKNDPYASEHVTPYIYDNPKIFKTGSYKNSTDLSAHRWTVDTAEDFELIQRIITALYPNKKDFNLKDILALLESNPSWVSINQNVQQKLR